jgi:hypothetical protein
MTEAPDRSERAEQGMNSAAACALKLFKMISVLFSFRLSIEVGFRSESFEMSKIQFQFSVFIHRRGPKAFAVVHPSHKVY